MLDGTRRVTHQSCRVQSARPTPLVKPRRQQKFALAL
jgi:hypothetical protein